MPSERQGKRTLREQNQQVRDREHCEQCGDRVPDEDFSTKFAQAGGCLSGPFCSSECYWEWLA
jgi:hypothetical protein